MQVDAGNERSKITVPHQYPINKSGVTMDDFETFKDKKIKLGFDEVLIRSWEPHFQNEMHSHPFDTEAVVVKGEYWLTLGKHIQHLKTGDTFKVPRDMLHSERYGKEGAVFWAARKN